jgi:uncharacterized FlaG/YvyC family protein
MKSIKNMQIWLIFLAFIVTLAVLFGGQALTVRMQVDNPFKHDIYAIQGVKKFKMIQDKEGIKVQLQLNRVANLQQVLDPIQQKVKFYYHKPIQEIQITDHSNHRLQEIRYQLSFNLEEAVVSGHYVQLRAALESYPQIKSRVYFSRDYIYIQLEDGSYYHYEAFPRQVNGMSRALVQGLMGGDSV